MTSVEQRLSRTREAIYAVLDDPDDLQGAIASLTGLVGGSGAFINLPPRTLTGAVIRDAVSHNIDLANITLGEIETGVHDPWTRAYIKRHGTIRDTVTLGQQLIPPATLERDPWGELVRRIDLSDVLMTTFDIGMNGETVPVVCTVHRSGRAEAFGKAEQAIMETLLRDLKRVVRATAAFAFAGSARPLSATILDQHQDGLIACAANGAIAYANAAGEALLRESALLSVHNGRLIARRPGTHEQLLARLAAARRGQSSSLSLGKAGDPLTIATILPLAAEPHMARDFRAEMLVIVRQPGRQRQLGALQIEGLFGLSLAEAAVAVLAAGGQSVREIATLRGVRPETVRSQIKAVHAKCGTHSRGELVALIQQLVPPVGPRRPS